MMIRIAKIGALAVLGLVLVGCGSSEEVIYPSEQDPGVKKSTNDGFTYLQSKKGQVTVTVSLREASETFVRAYVSVANRSGTPVRVQPTDIQVVSGDGKYTFPAYPPEEVPSTVQQSALNSPRGIYGVGSVGVSGQAVRGQEVEGASRGMYRGTGSGSTDRAPYLKMMLKGQRLPNGSAVGGYVFTPFQRSIQTFQVQVPVGGDTHTFQFQVQTS